jgi:hypothetical protein
MKKVFCPACGLELDLALGQVSGHDVIDHTETSGYELLIDIRCLVKEQLFGISKEEY